MNCELKYQGSGERMVFGSREGGEGGKVKRTVGFIGNMSREYGNLGAVDAFILPLLLLLRDVVLNKKKLDEFGFIFSSFECCSSSCST